MARNRNRRRGRGASRTASAKPGSNRRAYPINPVALPRLSRLSPLLSLYDDRRRFHPAPVAMRPAFSFQKAASRIVPGRNPVRVAKAYSYKVPATLAWADPSKVMVCVRRKIRREVLSALGVAGATGLRKGKHGPLSGIAC